MKQLIFSLFMLIFLLPAIGQDSTAMTKENYKAARKVLKQVESDHLKNETDMKAVELILSAKNASITAREYMGSLPGYEIAVRETLENENALKEFKEKVKAEDETYIELANKARSAQKEKTDYLCETSQPYSEQWEYMKDYRLWKANRTVD